MAAEVAELRHSIERLASRLEARERTPQPDDA
jgi:ubiquinone biosynthesis protein UbiJ